MLNENNLQHTYQYTNSLANANQERWNRHLQTASKKRPHITLSKREIESLFYTLCGKTAKEIAHILNLSKRTIEGHIISLKQKFTCETKSELFDKAIKLGYMNVSYRLFEDFL